jgi:transposase
MGNCKRPRIPEEKRREILRELDAGRSMASLAREYAVHPSTIEYWCQRRSSGGAPLRESGEVRRKDERIGELERVLGQLALENALLKKAIARYEQHMRRLTEREAAR